MIRQRRLRHGWYERSLLASFGRLRRPGGWRALLFRPGLHPLRRGAAIVPIATSSYLLQIIVAKKGCELFSRCHFLMCKAPAMSVHHPQRLCAPSLCYCSIVSAQTSSQLNMNRPPPQSSLRFRYEDQNPCSTQQHYQPCEPPAIYAIMKK